MKSKIIILVFMLCVSWYSSIIAQRTCGSELNISFIQQTDPHRYQRIIALEHTTLQRIQSVSNTMATNSSTIIIPVVVHVVYNTSNQNISENQINSQIQVLNEDFRRLNSDGVNTPTAFSGLASDVEIELRLASIDPNGNPTNGITRTSTTTTGFSWTADDVKNSSSGGQNAWDSRNYLNIWVCNITKPFAVLGYSQYPFDFSSSPNTDGVVIDFKNFGRDGSAISPYNKGRTATHEIGHWLNLFHIWGDDDDNNKMCTLNECNGTDHVDDTPNQGERNFGCPSFPRTDCCTPSGNGVMFMN